MKLKVEDYLPHRPPMILLDELDSIDSKQAISYVNISAKSLFFSEGLVPSWVGIEYMVQTMAAFSNFQARATKGPAIGFLLGTRSFVARRSEFLEGERLKIEVKPVLIDDPIGSFYCRIEIGDELVADANLTAYKPDKEFLSSLKAEHGSD